jgi:hypothetical protein
MGWAYPRRTSGLKTYLSAFKRVDRRSINNSLFIGQRLSKLPKLYTDFEDFGRLGVASFRLNWDYSNLRMNFKEEDLPTLPGKECSKFIKVGRVLSNYSSEDLQLLSRYFLYNGRALSPFEKRTAEKMMRNLVKKL